MSLSADTVVASGAVIPFDVEDWSEQWPLWAGGSHTIPRTGTYHAACFWNRNAPAASQTTTINVRLLGVSSVGQSRYPASAVAIRGTTGGLVRATAGDDLGVVVTQTSGAAVTIAAGSTLRVVRVGPERWTG